MSQTDEKRAPGRPPGPPKEYVHLWMSRDRAAWLRERAKESGEKINAIVESLLDKAAPLPDQPDTE